MIYLSATDDLEGHMFDPEFDHPFAVLADGQIDTDVRIHAPEVADDGGDRLFISPDNWTALAGYTGQYGYNGPVMHSSEQFAGRLYTDVMAEPGIYVLTVVQGYDDDEPSGWCVLRRDA
jgi:hypothetical protein